MHTISSTDPVGGGQSLIPGSLTPPDKLNNDLVSMTTPLEMGSLAPSINAPPSPLPTPSPPTRAQSDVNRFDFK